MTLEPLKACPYCTTIPSRLPTYPTVAVVEEWLPHDVHADRSAAVVCFSCGMRGPVALITSADPSGTAHAAKDWNRLPRSQGAL